jgi:hypothetical protein
VKWAEGVTERGPESAMAQRVRAGTDVMTRERTPFSAEFNGQTV